MGEVFLQAPPPLISCWPEYTGTEYKVDSCNKKFSNVIGYHLPDFNTNGTVYAPCF